MSISTCRRTFRLMKVAAVFSHTDGHIRSKVTVSNFTLLHNIPDRINTHHAIDVFSLIRLVQSDSRPCFAIFKPNPCIERPRRCGRWEYDIPYTMAPSVSGISTISMNRFNDYACWIMVEMAGDVTYPECLSKQNITSLVGSRVHHSLPWSCSNKWDLGRPNSRVWGSLTYRDQR